MDLDAWQWILIAVLVAIVVVFALSRGYNVKLKRGDVEAHFEKSTDGSGPGVSVGKGMKVKGSRIGNVSGIRGGAEAKGRVDVLDGASIKDSEMGDVTGVDAGRGNSGKRET